MSWNSEATDNVENVVSATPYASNSAPVQRPLRFAERSGDRATRRRARSPLRAPIVIFVAAMAEEQEAHPPMNQTPKHHALSKVPEVTLVFWIIKIAATTLGETGGDTVTMTLELGLPRRHRPLRRPAHRAGRRADPREEIPSLPLLGDDRRLHDRRHHHGRFRRPLARHRLHRRLVAAARSACWRARPLVLVAGHDLRQHGQHAEGRGVLLGRHHLLADARHRARRLDGRYRRARLRRRRAGVRRRPRRDRRRFTSGRACRACCCSGPPSS